MAYGKENEKAPAESGKRSVSDEEIKFALFGGDGEITDAELFENVIDNGRHFGIVENVEVIAADDVDITLIKFAESAFLRAFATVYLAHLIALERENKIVFVECNVACKRNGKVKTH